MATANKTNKITDPTKLKEARAFLNDWIDDYEKMLMTIAASDAEQDPVLIDGETETGHICQLMVDPKEVAPILLQYNYPIYRALGKDAPDTMWRELGRHFGLSEVCSVDL